MKTELKTKGIYLLPNIITTMALFSGFLAIISAISKDFTVAIIAVFIAMIVDSLDGRVARLTGTETEFGKEFDSLSDMVSFGVAPAIIMYSWGYQAFGKLGWAMSFVYVASVALRLAKFNSRVQAKDYFEGLPCPIAAATLMGFIWMSEYYMLQGDCAIIVALLLGAFLASLMVSNIPYYSFKNINITKQISLTNAFIIVILFFVFAIAPAITFFCLAMLYILSGLVAFLPKKLKNKLKQYMTKLANNKLFKN
jgi:CDP-diacylglycerol---serine O-phosphatidyltransferase